MPAVYSKAMTKGCVYCASNEAMPGIVKIGMTHGAPEMRMKQLFTTGVPLPHEIELCMDVENPREKEAILHQLLKTKRVHPRREFFRVTLKEVRKLFELVKSMGSRKASGRRKFVLKKLKGSRHGYL